MTHDQLLAQAADADRQADALFAGMHVASEREQPDNRGFRPLIPTGFEARAQEASDLRRMARQLRAEAEEAKPRPAARMSASPALTPPPSATPLAAAGTPPQPGPKPDPIEAIEAIVARILKA